jgi:hypothetical protein
MTWVPEKRGKKEFEASESRRTSNVSLGFVGFLPFRVRGWKMRRGQNHLEFFDPYVP